MTVVPKDLKGVSAYEFCALRPQRLDTEHGQEIRRLLMRPAPLTARSTRAAVAKVAVGISAGVAIRPVDESVSFPAASLILVGTGCIEKTPVVRGPLSVVSGPWLLARSAVHSGSAAGY